MSLFLFLSRYDFLIYFISFLLAFILFSLPSMIDIPNLSLQLGSPTLSLQTIQEGNDIYFDCHITANPRPNKPILWRFRGVPLHPQQGTNDFHIWPHTHIYTHIYTFFVFLFSLSSFHHQPPYTSFFDDEHSLRLIISLIQQYRTFSHHWCNCLSSSSFIQSPFSPHTFLLSIHILFYLLLFLWFL